MSQEKITLAVLGMDQHENGAVAVSRILREAQMQVSYMGRFQTPETVLENALDEMPDVIGISCHSWEYLTLVPKIIDALKSRDLDIPVIIGGSVITTEDARKMAEKGVAASFGSGAADEDIINTVRTLAHPTKQS